VVRGLEKPRTLQVVTDVGTTTDVIPAKAGIHLDFAFQRKSKSKSNVKMDPSFRWDDDFV